MSVALQYDKGSNILYATIIDGIGPDEFASVLDKITEPEKYPPDVKILWDVSSVDSAVGGIQCKLDMAVMYKKFPDEGKSKIAIVTSSDYTFGAKRKHDMISGEWPKNIRVFGNFSEGEDWLTGIE